MKHEETKQASTSLISSSADIFYNPNKVSLNFIFYDSLNYLLYIERSKIGTAIVFKDRFRGRRISPL